MVTNFALRLVCPIRSAPVDPNFRVSNVRNISRGAVERFDFPNWNHRRKLEPTVLVSYQCFDTGVSKNDLPFSSMGGIGMNQSNDFGILIVEQFRTSTSLCGSGGSRDNFKHNFPLLSGFVKGVNCKQTVNSMRDIKF